MASAPEFGPLPLLADGDPRTVLGDALRDWRGPPEALNQAHPGSVQAMHAAFAQAGARLLRTNTAQGNAAALAPWGLAERAEAINNSGSALARAGLRVALGADAEGGEHEPAEVARGIVAGTFGAPPPGTSASDPDWARAVSEQAIYLSDTGVDFLVLQHVTRLADAEALTRRLKAVSDAPVLATLQFDASGHSADGAAAATVAATLARAGADALGLSCGPGPTALEGCLEALLASGLPVAVFAGIHGGDAAPYAGAPHLDPAAFAAWLAPLAARGAAILGGCCGATPAHIAALARALGR